MDPPNLAAGQQHGLRLAVVRLCTEPDCYYVVLRPPGVVDCTLYDFTHFDQVGWNTRSLPPILYLDRGFMSNPQAAEPAMQISAKVFGKRIIHFPVLPWHISSKVEGWRLEAWFRTDNRITANDIMDRIHPEYRYEISPAVIDQRRETFRRQFNSTHWEPPLDEAPIAYQTVRGDGAMSYDQNGRPNNTQGLTGNDGNILLPIVDSLRNASQLQEQLVQTDGLPPIASLYENGMLPRNSQYTLAVAAAPNAYGLYEWHASLPESHESYYPRLNEMPERNQ